MTGYPSADFRPRWADDTTPHLPPALLTGEHCKYMSFDVVTPDPLHVGPGAVNDLRNYEFVGATCRLLPRRWWWPFGGRRWATTLFFKATTKVRA